MGILQSYIQELVQGMYMPKLYPSNWDSNDTGCSLSIMSSKNVVHKM